MLACYACNAASKQDETNDVKKLYLKYKEIPMNTTGQSKVSVLKHVIENPADMTTEMSFIGVGESLHDDWHVTSGLVVYKQQALTVNAVQYVVTRLSN